MIAGRTGTPKGQGQGGKGKGGGARHCFRVLSYLLDSMPEGGVHSVFFLPISFQLVDSTVPLDSCIHRPLPLLNCIQSCKAFGVA